MTPSYISRRVVTDRLAMIDDMLQEIRALPLGDRAAFFADRRNIWTAESCLRRSLEALFDLGRHMLTKGFGLGVMRFLLERRRPNTRKRPSRLQLGGPWKPTSVHPSRVYSAGSFACFSSRRWEPSASTT